MTMVINILGMELLMIWKYHDNCVNNCKIGNQIKFKIILQMYEINVLSMKSSITE